MKNERISYPSLIAVSVIVPVATAWLLYSNHRQGMASGWVAFLPHFHASLNALTILTLLTGFILIRLKIIRWHRMAMTTSFFMGVLFLVSYFIYHYLAPPAIYGDLNHDGILDLAEAETVGNARNIYLLILFSHIVMAVIAVPFVLFAFYFALTGRFVQHRKTVRFALPVWLYVSITGVLVYWLIRPYY